MSGKRQKTQQLQLAFMSDSRGEAPRADVQGTEPSAAKRSTESPANTEQLMEAICSRENLWKALKQVQANKGSAGIDGMTVKQLPGYLAKHWPAIRDQLLARDVSAAAGEAGGDTQADGGVRKLGIPTVVDRFIQQAVMQVLQGQWDRTFSEHSYGFRPGRSAHQAVAAAQQHMADGHRWVVDIDLEKFFDRVNHDKLMASVAKRVEDKRLLRLIRAFLNAGVMENGLVSPTDEGTPQGGPLSPLLSNLVLDELDRELEKRGHRFVRYADDCNIYVQSERAGQRVMKSVEHFISKRLKLKVNAAKSAVARPWERKFLGFTFTANRQAETADRPEGPGPVHQKVRELTRRTRGISVETMVEQLSSYLRGWGSYFGFCQTPSMLDDLNSWIRRRLRCFQWKQWKRGQATVRGTTAAGRGPGLGGANRRKLLTAPGGSAAARPCPSRCRMPSGPELGLPPLTAR